MNGRGFAFALISALIAVLVLIACGHTSSRTISGDIIHPATPEQGVTAHNKPIPGVFELDGQVVVNRTVSAESTVTSQGWDAYLANQYGTNGSNGLNVEQSGTELTLRAYSHGEYAYAVYGQAIGADPKPLRTLIDSKVCKFGGGRDDEVPVCYYIGAADYTMGAWRWFGPFGDVDVLVTVNSETLKSRFKSPSDNYYLCVLASNGSKAASALPAEGLVADFPVDISARSSSAGGEDPGGLTVQEIVTTVDENLNTEPAIVTGLTSTGDEAGITLTWDKNADPDVFLYQILRDDLPAPSVLTTVTPSPAQPSCTDTSVTPGRIYTYRVRARNDAGFGGATAVDGARKMGAPSVNASDGIFPDKIRVKWTKVEGATSYKIYRADNADAPKIFMRQSYDLTAAPEWNDYAVTAEASYVYWVQPLGQDEPNGPMGGPDEGFTVVLDPVEASATDGAYPDRVEIIWGADPSATGYNVYRSTDESMSDAVQIANNVQATTFSDTASSGCPWDTARWYFVRPLYNAVVGPEGQGDYGFRSLARPSNVSATQGTDALQVTVSWDAVNNATRYKVFRSDSPSDPNPTEIGEVAAPLTSYNDTTAAWDITEGVHYFYFVAALWTGPDTEISLRSDPQEGWRGIGVPQNVSATDGTYTDKVVIMWDTVSQASGYNIFRDGSFFAEVSAPATLYDDITAEASTTYSYYVTALITDGEGAQSLADNGYINLLPTAVLVSDPDPAIGDPPLTVSFDASGSHDDDGTIVSYDWDWEGDGTYDLIGGTAFESHVYSIGGFFTCTLRVWDDRGAYSTTTASVTTNTQYWTHTWGDSGYDRARSVDLDNSGNVYITGQTDSFSAGDSDVFLLKYSYQGILLWQKTWGGTDTEYGNALDMDSDGNVYIAGSTKSYGTGNFDSLLLKYSPDGSLLWEKTWGGGDEDYAQAISIDSSGNIYLAGVTKSFGSGNYDAFLLKYTSNGTLTWKKTWGGEGYDDAGALSTDGNGDIYVGGYTGSFGSNGDAFVVKYSTDGEVLWQKSWGGEYADAARCLLADANGNVYMVGQGYSATGTDCDAAIMALTSDGSLSWQRIWYGDGNDEARSVDVDSSGNVYVVGYTSSVGGASPDVLFLKLSSEGTLIWQQNWGAGNDNGYGVVLDNGGGIFLAGIAPNSSGTWTYTGLNFSTVGGTCENTTGSSSDCAGAESTPTGTERSPSGIQDTGGGLDDALIMKVDTSSW
jgi:uncharacterized delta-60 repeat protein